MEFIRPATHNAIPTYRVMNQYGEVLDNETGVDTEDGEALALYKNMVLCTSHYVALIRLLGPRLEADAVQ